MSVLQLHLQPCIEMRINRRPSISPIILRCITYSLVCESTACRTITNQPFSQKIGGCWHKPKRTTQVFLTVKAADQMHKKSDSLKRSFVSCHIKNQPSESMDRRVDSITRTGITNTVQLGALQRYTSPNLQSNYW